MRIQQRKNILLAGLVLLFIPFVLVRPDFGTDRAPRRGSSLDRIRVLAGGPKARPERGRYVPGRVLVKFMPSITDGQAEETLRSYGALPIKRTPLLHIYEVKVPDRTTVEEMIYALSRNPDIEYAEPNYRTRIHTTPNDEYFWRQYALSNPGGSLGLPGSPQGNANSDIDATAGWEETRGDAGVSIAIVDTGVDMDHPELKNKLISRGYDFVNNDADASDDHWHGTHVAGIAAAETNNSQGIAGVAWSCKILPVKVVDKDGEGNYGQLIDGIEWAVDNGARVINVSLGGDVAADALKDAVRYAYEKNVVVVASAGNDSAAVGYPAAYDEYVIAVASTDYADGRTTYSNFGTQIDVAAPGELILSLIPTWYLGPNSPPYAFASGTSQAAPHVAGLAALVRTIKPWLSPREVLNVIRYSADDVNSSKYKGKDDYIGYGRINMQKALVPLKIK